MAKKRPQAKGKPQSKSAVEGEVPVVGAREPCPCGSGRRYKACHGRAAAQAVTELVQRPFEGLAGERDLVALRELVPAATAVLQLKEKPADVPSVTLATVLPMAWPALRREDGSVLLGLQNDTASGDLSRDLADTLQRALTVAPGTPVEARRAPAEGPRLQDLLDPEAEFAPEVHTGFEFWVPDSESASPEVAASLERANEAAIPTERLTQVDAAYWCETPEKNHLRWVMPHAEEELLDALARLHAAGISGLGEGTRLVGSFRAHGLTVPVWDLPRGMSAADTEKPAAAFAERLADALARTEPLTGEERRARGGLTNRQVTLS
ncbi:SecC domain-containing protein-containing protein [Streptomyces albus]|uniref:SecC domain-containing protein-containing protein n=1 Tax=Streptomyces albus (strain ATCC 21838 / DSM 41398 / FERM P-419 / JCM 4703 / NBRC 107858) TaxID=1081613 RepID=A0A0B5ER93_STRA4|nr:SecC domain-containing protein-containing protein [Streptomyces albus]AOU78449.1 SecC domain-containing protein-containing protein [Streptomyces albus]AYN34195.1 topoisomerase II [Streptomyces albus]